MENAEEQANNQVAQLGEKERERTRLVPFLGGFFSVGGRMGFNIENRTKLLRGGEEAQYTYAYPVISYNDNRKAKIDRLKNLLGGKVLAPEGNSYRWYIKSKEAAELALSMQDYSPFRIKAITAFQNWAHTEDLAERVLIARELNEAIRKRQINTPKEAYKDFVRNPLFLAGVFESRGFLFGRKKENQTLEPVIMINSENVQLLEAIKEKYGGGISIATEHSRTLAIGRATAREILQTITPYLLSPLSEYQKAV